MGATAENTQREIGGLRDDMTSAIDEIERRLRGGMSSVAATDARVKGERATEDLKASISESLSDNPSFAAAGGAAGALATGLATFAAIRRRRASQRPTRRLKHQVGDVRGALGSRLDDLRKGGLLLKLDPQKRGYVRVTDARLGTSSVPKKGGVEVVKKLMWALLMALFTALGSVLAKRGAAALWQATVREAPPDKKKKDD